MSVAEKKLENLLNGRAENYIFPFLWMRGEDEAVIREYMEKIYDSNIRGVCVESRPHPDFCGPKWWNDMDIILDEARKRKMKVWILDDSHFPTGYANGAMKNANPDLKREGIICKTYFCEEGETFTLSESELTHIPEIKPSDTEKLLAEMGLIAARDTEAREGKFLGAVAEKLKSGEITSLDLNEKNELYWKVPKGCWKVSVLQKSCHLGYHSDYINMLDQESCRILIDQVYEPHWEHYQEDFGKTIAGFFSDEPELGNGHIYDSNAIIGKVEDLPWSRELEEKLQTLWKEDFLKNLSLLWGENQNGKQKAQARYDFMDTVTRLVEKNFSMQIGNWCREHKVEYIGHMIEDNGQHCRTGSSLGHYFRGLAGQDMAGIDDIGGQVFPQGEAVSYNHGELQCRDGEFYHFMLGSLGQSLAAIDPLKKGRSMCEVFGNYGWAEGVRLEKYLVDHFLVRGINHFVPHAFSMKAFPDSDCPPHFYAHGNNPQFRHFGELMKYTNRICELLNHGRQVSGVAVIYHGEGEWTGKTMFSQSIGRILTEKQIGFEYIPMDVFSEREKYQTKIKEHKLCIHTQEYKVVIVPEMEYITADFAAAIPEMEKNNICVLYAGKRAEGIVPDREKQSENKKYLVHGREIQAGQIAAELEKQKLSTCRFEPSDTCLRSYQYAYDDKSGCILLVNEGTKLYEGTLKCNLPDEICEYDPWCNCIRKIIKTEKNIQISLYPSQSRILLYGLSQSLNGRISKTKDVQLKTDLMKTIDFQNKYWKRSVCRSIEYPEFYDPKNVMLPDNLAEEKSDFSGIVRYENKVYLNCKKEMGLYIEDAYEGTEVFINGTSAGIQCVPPFYYNITDLLRCGENDIRIEIATTLERELAKDTDAFGKKQKINSLSGITSRVLAYEI